MELPQGTFSIVALDPENGDLGAAVQSKYFAVGGVVPAQAIERVLADDERRETRQLGAVDAEGRAAAFTGNECNEWAGHATGSGYAAQGNILAGEAVVAEMARAFEGTSGELAERLLAALEAGHAAGGGRRGH